jgi:serine O-acetyltransferase
MTGPMNEPMTGPTSLWTQIREDWHCHGRDWTKPGFRAVAVHRFGVWRMAVRPKLLRAPLSLLYRALYRRCRNVYGIELPYSVSLGRGVIVEHQGGIVVHGDTVIGDDCIIRQNCTLGIRRLDAVQDAPILGRGVQLGAGAVVLGRVTLGDGAIVGANAVVLVDVPAGALATGVPASIRLRGEPTS